MAKHAQASAVTVRLSGSGEVLEFRVSDDSAGFPAAAARHGSGLQGMSDRPPARDGLPQLRHHLLFRITTAIRDNAKYCIHG